VDYLLHSFSLAANAMMIESICLLAPSSKREEIARALISFVGPILVEIGCVNCRLYADVTDMNKLRLETKWRTQDDLTRHVCSEEYKKLLILMEMAAEPPTVEFHNVCQTRGLELVQEARQV
jgi:quinol monooxygenase YgiN